MEKIEIIEITILRLKEKSSTYLDLYSSNFGQLCSKSEFITCIKDLETEKFIYYEGDLNNDSEIVITRFGEEMLKKHDTYSNYLKSLSSDTLYDEIIKWSKNNIIVVFFILLVSIFAALAPFQDSISKLFFNKTERIDSIPPNYPDKIVVNSLNRFIDERDGKNYKTVKIGNQIWLAENFSYNASSGCWPYENDETAVVKYGYLYNWSTAITVCPKGWHVPSKAEFENLLAQFGGSGVNAYYKLLGDKSLSFIDKFGGWRGIGGGYVNIDMHAVYWSASEVNKNAATVLDVSKTDRTALLSTPSKLCGFSVR